MQYPKKGMVRGGDGTWGGGVGYCVQLINTIVYARNQSNHILTETLSKKKMMCCDFNDESVLYKVIRKYKLVS